MTTAPTNYHPPCIVPADVDTMTYLKDWDYCPTCGAWVQTGDTFTTCNPQQVRAHKKYLRAEAQKKTIRERMAAREQKFREAQARDERALYEIEHAYVWGR